MTTSSSNRGIYGPLPWPAGRPRACALAASKRESDSSSQHEAQTAVCSAKGACGEESHRSSTAHASPEVEWWHLAAGSAPDKLPPSIPPHTHTHRTEITNCPSLRPLRIVLRLIDKRKEGMLRASTGGPWRPWQTVAALQGASWPRSLEPSPPRGLWSIPLHEGLHLGGNRGEQQGTRRFLGLSSDAQARDRPRRSFVCMRFERELV
jgi:hypothetical protein